MKKLLFKGWNWYMTKRRLKKKSIDYMTRWELMSVPARKWNEDIGEFESLIIIPLRRRHDSGYRCMDFIAVKGNLPIARLSGCSDVIHINGIGGYGHWKHFLPKQINPIDWCVDSLGKSGLLRLFCGTKRLSAGVALSSFDVFAEEITNKNG